MAKKIRRTRLSLLLLFCLLLIPWVAMGIVAAAAFYSGLPDYAAIVIALAAALSVTFFIRGYILKRGRTK